MGCKIDATVVRIMSTGVSAMHVCGQMSCPDNVHWCVGHARMRTNDTTIERFLSYAMPRLLPDRTLSIVPDFPRVRHFVKNGCASQCIVRSRYGDGAIEVSSHIFIGHEPVV